MRQLRTIAAIGLALLAHPSGASAFCRKTTCALTPTPSGCTVSAQPCDPNVGLPLYWVSPCLSFSVQRDGSSLRVITAEALEQKVRQAYDNWMSAPCSQGGNPTLYVASYPQSKCDEAGYREGGPNQNLWVFRDADWESNIGATGIIALTTMSVNEATGEIVDADIELNSTNHAFTAGDTSVETDLLSIVQHESGHVLGIDHSRWGASTMGDSYVEGSIDKRTLETDDVEAVCSIFPPGQIGATCDPEPLGGFSVDCTDPDQRGCCSIARSRSGKGSLRAFSIVLLVLLRRRRSRSRDRGD